MVETLFLNCWRAESAALLHQSFEHFAKGDPEKYPVAHLQTIFFIPLIFMATASLSSEAAILLMKFFLLL